MNIDDFFTKFYNSKLLPLYRNDPELLELIIYTDYLHQIYKNNKSVDRKEYERIMSIWLKMIL